MLLRDILIVLAYLIVAITIFMIGVFAGLKAFHIGYYDCNTNELYFDEGKEPYKLDNQKYGVIDILHLTKARENNGKLSE